MANTFYNEILIDHNQNPYHKHPLPGANMTLEGVNPSCGDDIVLQLRVEDGVIQEGSFEGDGCAISQASADIMLDMIDHDQNYAMHGTEMDDLLGMKMVIAKAKNVQFQNTFGVNNIIVVV